MFKNTEKLINMDQCPNIVLNSVEVKELDEFFAIIFQFQREINLWEWESQQYPFVVLRSKFGSHHLFLSRP